MKIKAIAILPVIINFSHVYAGGFQMHEQNANLGDVHAAYAVNTSDASISFYNPAGLIEILSPKATNSAVTVSSNVSFKGRTSVTTNPAPDASLYPPVTGTGKVSTKGLNVIPALHFATPINDKFAFGLSIASPFAAELKWSADKFTRYNSTNNSIKTINFSPSIAYKVNNSFYIGGGPEIQYAEMQIDKIVGTSWDYTFQGQNPASFDSKVTNNLTNTAIGWHAGFIWNPLRNLKIGYSYRSRIDHKATGESKLNGKLAGWFTDFSDDKENKSKNLKATIKIPQTMALSAEYAPNADVAMVSTLIYTNWKIVQSFDLENVPTAFANPSNGSPLFTKLISTRLGFKDTYTLLNGIHWHYNNDLTLKTGFGLDQTPSNHYHRDLKTPDGNRYLLGLGANYKYSKNLNLEFGYMFVKVQETRIHNVSSTPPADIPVNTLNPGETNEIYGKANGSAHLFGMQFTVNTQQVMKYLI